MSKLIVLLTFVVAVAAFPAGASAHGTAVPHHEAGAVECVSGGIMRVRPPRKMSPYHYTTFRNPERVAWSPDLYKWNGSKWVLVDGSRPFYYAWTSSHGYYQGQFQAAWQGKNGSQILFVPFNGLTAGTYAVKNYMWWGRTGKTHAHWGDTCRFV